MSHNAHSSLAELQSNMYFGTEVVNRVSFLRENADFIADAINHPSCRFIFYNQTDPLIVKDSDNKLVILTNGDNQIISGANDVVVNKGLASNPEWKRVVDNWAVANKECDPDIRGKGKPVFLFMGLYDESVGLNLASLKQFDDERYLDFQGRYQGIPFFAVDVTGCKPVTEEVVNHVKLSVGDNDVFFTYSRRHYLAFPHHEAALFSHGKMYLDWLSRNKFCPGCGSTVIPIHAGGKLRCTNETKTDDKWECPVRNASVSNVSFPRTDAVVITAVTNTDRSRILLSLNKRHNKTRMYSCTAGFMEPSETVEVATRREIWEETGVTASKIELVMTQPWPFPGNLMIGCVATVDFNGTNEAIDLEHDGELLDAKWFDTNTIRKLVYPDESSIDLDVLLPMPESIAFSLIKLVVDEYSKSKL
ncbi:NAD-capped RNA hydrolase Npy1p [Diutina catenulata]